jgi:DNA-binding NarL/FixJ family response regulator
MDAIRASPPDLVLVDLSLGAGPSGLELVKMLAVQYPHVPALVVSMHDEALYAERALRAGARGYLMKSEAQDTIVEATRRVLRGHVHMSESAASQLLSGLAGGHVAQGRSPVEELSDRELEVFEHIGHGRSTREIAEAMLISPKTVESYRVRIREKLAVPSHSHLVQRAVRWVEVECGG